MSSFLSSIFGWNQEPASGRENQPDDDERATKGDQRFRPKIQTRDPKGKITVGKYIGCFGIDWTSTKSYILAGSIVIALFILGMTHLLVKEKQCPTACPDCPVCPQNPAIETPPFDLKLTATEGLTGQLPINKEETEENLHQKPSFISHLQAIADPGGNSELDPAMIDLHILTSFPQVDDGYLNKAETYHLNTDNQSTGTGSEEVENALNDINKFTLDLIRAVYGTDYANMDDSFNETITLTLAIERQANNGVESSHLSPQSKILKIVTDKMVIGDASSDTDDSPKRNITFKVRVSVTSQLSGQGNTRSIA